MGETKVSSIVSERFCAPDSDIIFQSCDGVLFKIHRKNVEAHTKVLSLCEPPTEDVVPLPEDSVTLNILFQFFYPRMQNPKLEGIDFTVLAALAEAAEKYKIRPAVDSCNLRMRSMVRNHPFGVLSYGGKHGYLDIADLAAPLTLDMPLKESIDELGPSVAVPWIKYCGEWLNIRAYAYNWSSTNQHTCRGRPEWSDVRSSTLLRLGKNIGSLRHLNVLFSEGTQISSCCEHDMALWREAVEEKVRQVRNFSTFLSSPSIAL